MLKLETYLSQENVPYTGETYVVHLLLKLISEGSMGTSRVGTNLALLIDNSGSMYGSDRRIQLALEAAKGAISRLGQTDLVSVIAFSDYPAVVQPAIPAANLGQINQAVQQVLNTPCGGTNLPAGMQVAYNEVRRNWTRERLNRVLLLTDGNTEGNDDHARAAAQIAQQAAANGVSFSTFGLGEDWNQPLLSHVAEISSGKWYYISDSGKIDQTFQAELGVLLSTAYNNIRVGLKFFQNDVLREAKIVSPEIKEVAIYPNAAANSQEIAVGAMQPDVPLNLLLTLQLVNRELGNYNVAMTSLAYDAPGQPGLAIPPQGVVVSYVSDTSLIYKNGEVLRWLDDVQVDKMVRRATQLATSGNKREATQLLVNARNLSERHGNRPLTKLINGVIQEVDGVGGLSRKTQLETLNQVRKTSFQPQVD